ncbi:MAG: acyltransferase family protein, partial [Acidimicrobiales bacterium]
AGLAAIAVAATTFTGSSSYPGHAALLPVAGAAAVVVGGSALVGGGVGGVVVGGAVVGGRRRRLDAERRRLDAQLLLGTSAFQRLGAWSYSWYLWHWPVLLLAPHVLGHRLSTLEAVAMAALSLVIAVVSFVVVERPIRRMRSVARRPALGLAGAGTLAVASVAVILVAGDLVPSLTPGGRPTVVATTPISARGRAASAHAASLTPAQLTADLEAGVRTKVVPANLTPPLAQAGGSFPVIVENGCHLQHAGTRSKPCIYGDREARTTVVLFGDSHAAAWFPALELIAVHEHWKLVDETKAGCPPVEVEIMLGGVPYTACTTWRQNALAQIRALHPALVVAAWARYLEEPEARPLPGVANTEGSTWADGVHDVFLQLHADATHVLFVSDGPTLPWLAPDCVAGHETDVTACTVAVSEATRLPAVKAKEMALARGDGVIPVDPTPWFCTSSRCPVIVGNIILYRDMAHMVPAWSEFIAPVVADTVVPIVTGKAAAGGW